jgi:type I restriction enzyme S subunit
MGVRECGGAGVWELPEGWEWHALGEVCEINPRKPGLERDEDAPTSFVPMAAVGEEQGAITDMQIRPYQEVKRGYTYFEEGDVLFAKITPCMENGKAAIARDLLDGIGFGSTEFHRLRPGNEVTPKWIHLFVRQQSFRDEAASHFRGSVGQQRVPKKFLENRLIPVPPTVEEQRRIVARIEELFARVAEARRLRAIADEDTELLMSAALADTFEDLRKRIESAEPLGSLVSEMRNGMSKRTWVEPPEGIASLNIGNVTQHDFSVDSCRRVLFDPERHTKYLCQKDDLLVCNVNGSPKLVGAAAVFPGAGESMVFDHNITRLRLEPDVTPRFVAYHLREPATRVAIEARFATSSGQSYLPQKKLSTVPILVPPLSQQRRVVEYLDNLTAQIGDLKRAREITVAELERLEQSILARAFRGEL